jgi:hypothetical protein
MQRLRFRLSLRTLIIVVAVLGTLLGFTINRERQRRRANYLRLAAVHRKTADELDGKVRLAREQLGRIRAQTERLERQAESTDKIEAQQRLGLAIGKFKVFIRRFEERTAIIEKDGALHARKASEYEKRTW